MPSPDSSHPDLLTDRLVIRPFNTALPSDYEKVLAIYNSPSTLNSVGDVGIHTPEDIDRRCDEQRPASSDPSISLPTHPFHLVYLRSTDTHIGMITLFLRPSLPAPDLGYTIAKEHVGHGYATEVAKAVLKWWTEKMKVEDIWAGTLPTNLASQRVAGKIGFVEAGKMTIIVPGDMTKTSLVFAPPNARISLDGLVLDVRRKVSSA